MASVETIWYQDIQGFLALDNLAKFIPDREMTFAEQLNALMRLSLYFSCVLLILKHDARVLIFVFVMAFFTYIIYAVDTQEKAKKKELFDKLNLREDARTKTACVKPSLHNPFMNVSYDDRKNFSNRPQACDITNKKVRKEVDGLFETNLVRDIGDIYHNKASDRQFYTTPITTIPNDQTSFANWLYGVEGKTCKEGNNVACLRQLYNPRMRA